MIPGPSSRTRQSWTSSLPSSENPTPDLSHSNHEEVIRRKQQVYDSRMPPLISTDSPHSQVEMQPIVESQLVGTLQQRKEIPETSVLYDSLEDRIQERNQQLRELANTPSTTSSNIYSRSSQDSRYDLYDRTRPESVYSKANAEQIYDRINDPIYEHVRVNETTRFGNEHQLHHHYQPSVMRYPVSHAEPQVPIYRPVKRVVARRASEGSGCSIGTPNDPETMSYGSIDVLRSSNPGSRLSIESRRDSSPASKDSTSPYDSNSTLTGNECSDDSVIMNRLRKSLEQKAEFLRRPSHPIGWFISGETSESPRNINRSVIQREFYARPQKLQRSIWPPNDQQQRQQSPPTRSSQEKTIVKPTVPMKKPSNQNVQRIKTDGDSDSEYSRSLNDRSDQRLMSNNPTTNNQSLEEECYPLLYDNEFTKETYLTANAPSAPNEQQYRSASKSSFVSTLSRIHENSTSNGANQQQSEETRNDSSSVPSSPGPDKQVNDVKFPVPPQGLQIVSKRAKQFESGCLLSDEDEPTSDRTSLYKSELSRLSNKKSVPNVAVRKREFESKVENQEARRLQIRETKSLETGEFNQIQNDYSVN